MYQVGDNVEFEDNTEGMTLPNIDLAQYCRMLSWYSVLVYCTPLVGGHRLLKRLGEGQATRILARSSSSRNYRKCILNGICAETSCAKTYKVLIFMLALKKFAAQH